MASRDRRTRKTARSRGTNGAASILAVLLAIVAVAAVIAAVQLLGPSPAPGASPSATAAATSAGIAGAPSGAARTATAASPSPSAAPNLAGATFTTPGIDTNWQGFTWSNLPADSPLLTADPGSISVFKWSHGFVAQGTRAGNATGVVWTSADGQTWTEATSFSEQERVLVAISPHGLVAIGGTSQGTADMDTVWTSTDGLTWIKAGPSSGAFTLGSIAGTSSGLVAVESTTVGSGKFATAQYGLATSADGLTWTPVTRAPAVSDQVVTPSVSSNAGRFFLLGAPTALSGKGGGGVVWWSDDGQTWTAADLPLYPKSIDFGSSGMILHTSTMTVGGGGFGLEVSADGGKTWQVDDKFGPLGATVCGVGECSVGPDGEISSNGTTFLAVKPDGHAWTSIDGKTWTPIAWNGPATDTRSFLVMPRGVVVGNSYGAAK